MAANSGLKEGDSLAPDSAWSQRLRRVYERNQSWVWADVICPLIITRCALLLAGWFSQFILPNPDYPVQAAVARGWHFSRYRLLDMWGRWDTGWYLSIVQNGYVVNGDLRTVESNIAFFPLYPYLVKLLALPLPQSWRTPGSLLLIGVVLSNVFLLAALILLHRLIRVWSDRALARRTILYLLLFPTGFFLSCFYTESLFLFLSIGALFAAARKVWAIAGLLGAGLALTRPQGVLIGIPLIWAYCDSINWKPSGLRKDILWLALIPTALVAFLAYAYYLTGDLLAPVHIQQAWHREFTMPWTTFIHPVGPVLYITRIEQALVIIFLTLGCIALRRLPSAGYGIYSLLLLLVPLSSGMLTSTVRYEAVIFPIFIVLALMGRRAAPDLFIKTTFISLQILFVIAWSQFYWLNW